MMADINMTSTAFSPGSTIPDRYTCKGDGISPPLQWQMIPEETRSLTLIMDDPDAPGGLFSHWVLYNLSPEMDGLPENFTEDDQVFSGRNSFGQTGYGGPCPPAGETHHYYFRLYALDKTLELNPGATRAQVIDAMQGHILAETAYLGMFGA